MCSVEDSCLRRHHILWTWSGGIGIMIRDSISKAITVDSPGEIMVWVTLKSKYFTGATKDIKIAGVYLQASK